MRASAAAPIPSGRAEPAGLSRGRVQRALEPPPCASIDPTHVVDEEGSSATRDTGEGPRCGDRGRSRMGGSRRPCRQGGRAREYGRVGSVESRLGGLQPFPPLYAANAPHAGHRGVAGGRALAGSGRRPAQRRHGAADRLPAAELEVEPAAAHPIRSPPLGDGGVVPRPSRTCEPGSPAATASVCFSVCTTSTRSDECSTCCSPRESTSACGRWPRPRPRTGSGS